MNHKILAVGLLLAMLVLSPLTINAQIPTTPPSGSGGTGSTHLQNIYSRLDEFTVHHTSPIDILLNQILRILISLIDQPCQQDGAVYNFQTGQSCSVNVTPVPNLLPPISDLSGPPPLVAGGTQNTPINNFRVVSVSPDGQTIKYTWSASGVSTLLFQFDHVTLQELKNANTGEDLHLGVRLPSSGELLVKASNLSGETKKLTAYLDPLDSNGHQMFPIEKYRATTAINIPPAQSVPVINSISPSSGSVGQIVTISGRNFTNPTDIAFVGATNTGSPVSGEAHVSADPVNNVLTFTIPTKLRQWGGGDVPDSYPTVVPGKYYFVLDTNGGRSSAFYFTVTGNTSQPVATILRSDPQNGEIDAGDTSQGLQIMLTMHPAQSPAEFPASAFSVNSTKTDLPISVTDLTYISELDGGPNTIILSPKFSRAVLPGERITIIHRPSGSSTCLGWLPGDVNGDGRVTNLDTGMLNGVLAGTQTRPWHATNIDNDIFSYTNEADRTRLNELLNGTNGQERWLLRTLPACPAPVSTVTNPSQMANVLSVMQATLKSLQTQLQNR